MSAYPLFLDIETCPADRAGWTPPAELTGPVTAPGNLKDPAKIAEAIAKREAERVDEIEAKYAKTSFDVHEGRLLCVGLAVGDDAPTVAYDESLGSTTMLLDAVLAGLREALHRGNGRAVVVGHNIAAFDAPWIWRLAVKHRHPLAAAFPWRKWGEGLADTMGMWCLTNPREYVKLDVIARFLGVAPKMEGMSGAEVWPAYQRGEHEKIRAYCAQDVETTRAVYRAMVGA